MSGEQGESGRGWLRPGGRPGRALGGIVGLVGLVAAGVGLWAASATGTTGPGTMRVTDTQTGYRRLDLGRGGKGVGDVEIIRQSIFNRRITKQAIGRGELLCTFIEGTTRNCMGTYSFPRGNIVVGGVIGSRLIFEAAILGGTGIYADARGTLTVTATGFRPRREVLVFRLAG